MRTIIWRIKEGILRRIMMRGLRLMIRIKRWIRIIVRGIMWIILRKIIRGTMAIIYKENNKYQSEIKVQPYPDVLEQNMVIIYKETDKYTIVSQEAIF